MCWRDEVREDRWCPFCGASYFGDLGHRNCPTFAPKPEPTPEPTPEPLSAPAPAEEPKP
jgi:hypothetical protein